MGRKQKVYEREYKTLPAVTMAVDEDKGIVEAIVAVFGNIDDGDDIIHPGAFTKTLSEHAHRVKVLDQHRTDTTMRVVGLPIVMREVGRSELPPELLAEYPEATGGLWTKTQYLMDTKEGEGVFKRIKAKALTEYSFGYDPIVTDLSKVELPDGKKKTVRNLRELRLWEYSPVIWGMNPATATVSAKDAEDEKSESEKEYTPDGPQEQLGDVLISRTHRALMYQASRYLEDGYLSAEEYLSINAVATSIVEAMQSDIDEDIRLRPIEKPDFMFLWEADGGSAEKADDEKSEQEDGEGVPSQDEKGDETPMAGPRKDAPTPGDTGNTDEGVRQVDVERQRLDLLQAELDLLEVANA